MSELALLIEACGLADEHVLPRAGGLLDQTQWFIEAWRFYRGERDGRKPGN